MINQFLSKLYSLTDPNEIADFLANYIKKPVIIEDHQFSLLAYSSYYIDQFDEVNKQTIFSKRWTMTVMDKFLEKGIVDKLRKRTTPMRIEAMPEIGLNQRIVVSAVYKETILGYIWVQESNTLLSDEEIELLQKVSAYIGKLLYEEQVRKQEKYKDQYLFLQEILDNHYQSDAQILWEAIKYQLKIPDYYLLTVFRAFDNNEKTNIDLIEKIELLSNTMKLPTFVFPYDNNILVIIGSDTKNPSNLSKQAKELINVTLQHFEQSPIFAGISNIHSSLLDLPSSYSEALEVIKVAKFLGRENIPSYEFNRLGILKYLEAIATHHGKAPYNNEVLQILQEKDKESQTNLLETLEVYLLNNCRLKATAEKLFIHPNTLKYRLNQISELTSITFDDFLINCQLYIDIQLLKIKNKEYRNKQK